MSFLEFFLRAVNGRSVSFCFCVAVQCSVQWTAADSSVSQGRRRLFCHSGDKNNSIAESDHRKKEAKRDEERERERKKRVAFRVSLISCFHFFMFFLFLSVAIGCSLEEETEQREE